MEKTFTIIGEYWDNEQGYAAEVRSGDEQEAMEKAQAECRQLLRAGRDEPDEEEAEEADEPLRIWAVLEGTPEVVYLRPAA